MVSSDDLPVVTTSSVMSSFWPGFHLEAAAQGHHIVHPLGEDGGHAQLAAQFVGHDDAAHSRSHHHINGQVLDLLGDDRDDALGTVRILQELGALAVTVAVTAGGEQEMAFQQGF